MGTYTAWEPTVKFYSVVEYHRGVFGQSGWSLGDYSLGSYILGAHSLVAFSRKAPSLQTL